MLCRIEYTATGVGFELTTLVVIGSDCIGSCKSNFHTITTTMVRLSLIQRLLCDNIYQNISLQTKNHVKKPLIKIKKIKEKKKNKKKHKKPNKTKNIQNKAPQKKKSNKQTKNKQNNL